MTGSVSGATAGAGATSSEISKADRIALAAIFGAKGEDADAVQDAVTGLQTLLENEEADDGERKDGGDGDFEGQRRRDEEVVRSYFCRCFAAVSVDE